MSMDADLEQLILEQLPYADSFLFVDGLTSIDTETVEGHYTFSGTEPAIQGHFAETRVIPGVILLEMMGQIGMVCHLIYLLSLDNSTKQPQPVLANVESEFLQTPEVGEKLIVKGTKIYFRNNILKSSVVLQNEQGNTLAQSTIIVKSK